MNGEFTQAIYAIFIAALFDGLDGRVARAIGAQSAFGEQFDSLSDLLAFGVAPAILMYSWSLHDLGRIGLACCFIYTACAAFRLARFNVQIGVVDKRYFIGVASPLAAVMIISMVWVGRDFPNIFDLTICGITNRGIYSGCDDLQYSCRHISDFNHLCTFWFCHYLSSS